MARVENPKTEADGEVICEHCPLDAAELCSEWWHRNGPLGFKDRRVCPKLDNYTEACEFAAEKEAHADHLDSFHEAEKEAQR